MAAVSPLPRSEIRVLIVDDSPFMRRSLERLLARMAGVTVVGGAADGIEALKLALELRPDVITMDVEMPRMDGVTAVSEIMRTVPTPIVMVSTLTAAGTDTTLRALEAGAVEVIAKPSGLSHELANVGEKLAEAVTRASFAHVHRRRPLSLTPRHAGPPGGSTISNIPSAQVVVIGSSTGGPPALTEVVPHLPQDLNAGVLVVQHMPAGFTKALARRLDSLSPLEVVEASEGDVVCAGRVLVAPGDFHMRVGSDRRVRLDQSPSLHGVRPSVDITLDSVTEVYGRHASVAILTGMGRDGADGAARLEQAGGRVFTQDEATCVVYGMPRVTKERTQHAMEAPIDKVAQLLTAAVRGAVR
jgi:two-component system chemotaxis response regulator CheB